MATRPVFLPNSNGKNFVTQVDVDFQWFAGLSIQQKQKSVVALHDAARKKLGNLNILEISTKSTNPLGVALSAFNLMSEDVVGRPATSIEVSFQASKKFENGGPYLDLLEKTSREAKGDSRLKSSGALVGFDYAGESWPIEPKTSFYDWLYLHAVHRHNALRIALLSSDGFTDIEFNPVKSISCQARSAALYVSLERKQLLEIAISSKSAFLRICSEQRPTITQTSLF